MRFIEKITLKNKSFKVFKINKFEVYIFKKLHLKILENTSSDFDSPYNYSELNKDLKDSGIFLVYYKNKPIAYTFVYLFKEINSFVIDFKKYSKIPKKDLFLTAELCGSGVLEEFRGLGLQSYFIKLREDYLIENKIKYSVISVHPDNIYSKRNILKNGYKFISCKSTKLKIREYFKKKIIS
jgi:ribosomal protein S18 acetylase RimI-like enzyme